MARQGTAKQALEAQKQEQINAAVPATPATPPATPTPTPTAPNPQDTLTGSGVASDRVKAVVSARTPAPQAPQSVVPPAPTPAPTPTPQTIQQPAWNYGTAENPVYAQAPQAPEAKPAQKQPVTTEIGREQAFGQLAKQPEAQTRQAELKSVRENLKDDSGKQLWDNMASISASNPNLLQDRNAYNQAFGYDGKDAGEKAMVDSYWRSTRPKSEDIYRSLESGQGVPQRSLGTPEAVEAIERKSELTKYENLNPYQLSKLIGSELIPGSQVYNDLSTKNPSLITNATKLAQINLPVTNQIAPKTNWQDAISQMMQKSPTMQDPMTVEKIMNSDPAISQKTNEVNQYDNQINELTQQQKNLLANVTERYKGTGASKATINARYLSESRDLTDQLALLTAQKNSASLALTTLIQNGKDNYEMSRQSRLDAEASYYKNMDAMMQMTQMGMQQENLEYQRAQEAINRDLQQMQYWQQREDGFVKDELSFERDLYKTKVTQEYQMQMDERNFNQQKELAKMGYNQAERMSSINYNQDINKLRLTNDLQTNNDLQKRVMDMRQQGYSDQDIQNTIYGGGNTQQTNVGDYIKSKEGFRDQAYLDSAGVPTIGYGFTSVNGRPVKMGDTMDRATADAEFDNQIKRYQNFQNLVTVPLSESQKAALTSFEYNLGGGIWKKDAMPIITAINNGDLNKAGQLMQQYNKAGGKFVQGLANRRAEEAQLLQQGATPTQSAASVQVEPAQYPSYVKYIESGVLPAGMKEGSAKAQQFQQQAQQGYIDAKNSTFKQQGFELSNPQAFVSTTPKQREEINNAVMQVTPFTKTMDELIALTDKYGTENPYSAAGREMNQKVKNAQLIAKEIYNPGVLNGPDLSLMEAIIPRPTSFGANTIGVTQNYGDLLREAKKTILGNAIFKAQSVGLSQIGTQGQSQGQAFDTKAFAQDIINSINNR